MSSRVSLCVCGPTQISPVGEASFRRDARFTVSPITVKSRFVCPPTSPARTRPELMPTWMPIATGGRSCAFHVAMRLRISIAALTACRAACSSACGTPNSAMMQSPMNLSTWPPCVVTQSSSSRKQSFISSVTSSGSSWPERAVKPETSANITVA
jgi:hypothetical protein